jgi:hypothetical protein
MDEGLRDLGRKFDRFAWQHGLKIGVAGRYCESDQWGVPSSPKPGGISGGSEVLQIGHGAPAAPQPHASSPNHGLSGWASQTHKQPSQRQQIIRACGMA